jgi:hypothetical protein
MFEKVQRHGYCNLGVLLSLAFENADIIGEDNEVVLDLHDAVLSTLLLPA